MQAQRAHAREQQSCILWRRAEHQECLGVQMMELRASSERLAREKASAQVELAGLRERLGVRGVVCQAILGLAWAP